MYIEIAHSSTRQIRIGAKKATDKDNRLAKKSVLWNANARTGEGKFHDAGSQ